MAIITNVITSQPLSGLADYDGISFTETATQGFEVHAAHATSLDEIWIYAVNVDTAAARTITVETAASTGAAADAAFEHLVNSEQGLYCIVPGWTLTGGAVIRVFATGANDFNIFGYVNRIT